MRAFLLPANDPRLPAIVERLKGDGVLLEESKALGFTHNGQLRTALRQLLGAEQYDRIMKENLARRTVGNRVSAPKPSSDVPAGQSA